MATLDFLATVVLLSASGVLGPGPLFLASTLRATKRGTVAGIECAVGHTLVEFPLVVGLAIGLQAFLQSATDYVAIAGGAVLLVFASLQLFQATKKFEFDPAKVPGPWAKRNGIVIGVAFTALNPFFIIWWATVGALLITEASVLGAFAGVIAMFAAHIWMDYAWLGGTAALVGRTGKLVLGKWYRALLVAFSLAMLYFGTSFILSAIV
jgi:threonine/homoserine/homoserine lactone efflux protein